MRLAIEAMIFVLISVAWVILFTAFFLLNGLSKDDAQIAASAAWALSSFYAVRWYFS